MNFSTWFVGFQPSCLLEWMPSRSIQRYSSERGDDHFGRPSVDRLWVHGPRNNQDTTSRCARETEYRFSPRLRTDRLVSPILMTLVTGHYAHRHGVTGNDPSPKYAPRNSDAYRNQRAKLISYISNFETVPQLLAKQNYLSHQSGKWWEGNFRHGGFTHGMTRGFPSLEVGTATMDSKLVARAWNRFLNSLTSR